MMPASARESGPVDVVTALPRRRPGSVRRTVSFDVVPNPSWDAGVIVSATARDRAFDAAARPRPLAEAQIQVELDAASTILALRADVPSPVRETVVGSRAVSGFRGKLAAVSSSAPTPDQLDDGSLTSALLDDLPTVRMVNGYARMMELPTELRPRSSPLVGVCAGWQAGGTATRRTESAEPLLNVPPASPPIQQIVDDPEDFPDDVPLRPSSMRRRRILELTRRGDEIDVFEYFRDSHVDPHGREGALHEYVVRLTLGSGDLVVRAIEVEPRALPFPECPLAAPNAVALVGTSLGDVVGTVRAELSGVRGCTHLNDVLRFLRFAGPLSRLGAALLEGEEPDGTAAAGTAVLPGHRGTSVSGPMG